MGLTWSDLCSREEESGDGAGIGSNGGDWNGGDLLAGSWNHSGQK